MGAFFDKLLESRGLTAAPVPLWKMNVRDDEYVELAAVVQKAISEGKFANHGKEFALFYAESWRRKYDGGWISKDSVAAYAGISHDMAGTLFQYAKAALPSLHIPVIRQNNNLYFRTLLLQGGLPMAYIKQKNQGFNKFKDFLKQMVRELSQLAVDWEDIDVVKSLNCIRYLPKSYHDENIYALSLQIVRAIVEERDDLLPYDTSTIELKDLTTMLKTERDRMRRQTITHPLTINWALKIEDGVDGGKGVFRYSLGSAKTIRSEMVNGLKPDECFQFDLFVSQSYVATYKKVRLESDEQEGRSAIYKRLNSDNKEFVWNGESVVEVKLLCDNGDELFPSVINNCAPNLSTPQLFQKKEGVYVQQQGYSSPECIVLHTPAWSANLSDSAKSILLNGESYRLTLCPSMDENQFIVFTESQTGEVIELQNRTSKYSAIFEDVFLPWLEKANYALLAKHLCISVYDEQGMRVTAKPRILYREKGAQDWLDYSDRRTIKPGIVSIRVEFPDGSSDEKRFYFIGDLGFETSEAKATSACVKCKSNWGNVKPIAQENVRYELEEKTYSCVTWKVNRTPDTLKFPSTCSFEIVNPGNPVLKISIPSPYNGLCLVKNEDELVRDGAVLSFNEFASYRILCAGDQPYSIRIGYKDVHGHEHPINIYQNVKNGTTPLSNFEDSINRIFNVYGLNPFDQSAAVELAIGDKTYQMRHFTRASRLISSKNALGVHTSGFWGSNLRSALEDAFAKHDGNLFACRLSGPTDEFSPEVLQFERQECGHFVPPQDIDDGDYVVFSDAYDVHRVIPRRYRVVGGYLYDDSAQTSVAQDSIRAWAEVLEKQGVSDANSWGKISSYIEIAEKYRLPFRTFKAISAAASSPVLMTKLLFCLVEDDKLDALTSAILRIEQECAMAIHWNQPEIVSEQFQEATKDCSPREQIKFFEELNAGLRNIMTMTLDADVAEMMTRFLCGNHSNKKNDWLTNAEVNEFRSRAIGKNTGKDINSDMPVQEFPLKREYYDKSIQMLPYQETLIRAPLYVYEYTQGWNDGLWESTPESIQRRMIINFYRMHYKYTYYTILAEMLK